MSAENPLIQTDSSSVGSVVDAKQIQETPVNGRENGYALLGLAPGVQRPNSNALISGSSFQGGSSLTVDGITDNDMIGARMNDMIPSLDDLSEFTTIDVDAPAEYGNGGAQVIIATKGGTNNFHGTVFYFNRNRFFSARNFFLAPGARKPTYNRHEYGGSLGGPILHDRLFFETSFEGIHSVTTAQYLFSMPPPAFLTGNFQAYTTLNGAPTIVYDPTTGLPFQNNQIPAARISPIAQKFLAYYSTPNVTTANGLGSNYSYSSPTGEIDPRFSIRLDYQLDPKDRLTFRYFLNRREPQPYDEGGTENDGNYALLGNIANNFSGNWTRIFNSNLVNEVVIGADKRADPRVNVNSNVDPTSLINGLPPVDPGFGILPTINVTNLATIYDQGSSTSHQNTLQFNDNLTYTRGKHSIKTGFQVLHEHEEGVNYNTGGFTFTGEYTGRYTLTKQTTNAVNAFADFLLGYIAGDSTANAAEHYGAADTTYALYASDNWSVSPKVTLNLGARYDKILLYDVQQGGLATFSPAAGGLVLLKGQPSAAIAAKFPLINGADIGYTLNNWLHMPSTTIAPRIGLVVRPYDNKPFVIRAGYGIFYDNLPFSLLVNNLANQLPAVLSTTYAPPSQIVPGITFANPFPTTGSSAGTPNAFGADRTQHPPYNQQWNLTIEGQTLSHTAFRVSYIGNAASHLVEPYPENDIIPQAVGGVGEPATVQAARPYPEFSNITYYTYGESTNVNQLQAAAVRRFAGLTFDLQYQWTKALGEDGGNNEIITNRSNVRADYGNLDSYVHHQLSLNYEYVLPVGQGQKLLGNANTLVQSFLGGWKLSGIWKATSGTPFSASFSSSLNGFPSGRAQRVPGVPLYPAVPNRLQWFNPAAFAAPTNYTFGNSQRNLLFGPRFSEWDAGIFKDFPLPEKAVFEFRCEAFDVLNRTNFGNPSANITNLSTVGTITGTAADNRELQFGGRIRF